jgi:hypothetical protein
MIFANIIVFILTTVLYFMKLKPSTTTNDYQGLGIYVIITMLLQFVFNLGSIWSSCGSISNESMGAAGLITFGYWLILVMAIAALASFPSLKSAFADVFGYLVVRNEANELLSSMLSGEKPAVDTTDGEIELKDMTDKGTTDKGTTDKGTTDKGTTNALAAMTAKLLGNKSLVINELTPTNFDDVWTQKYAKLATGPDVPAKSLRLRELTERRDSIGEAMWYLYTGIFVTMFVDMKIKLRGCMSSQAAMQQQYADFKNAEDMQM